MTNLFGKNLLRKKILQIKTLETSKDLKDISAVMQPMAAPIRKAPRKMPIKFPIELKNAFAW